MYALRIGRRRDSLVIQLAGQLADAREREGVLRERLAWFEAAMPSQAPALRLADGCGSGYEPHAPRRSAARRTSM